MLAIRLQRTGRSGHAMFRIIVQDSRRSPTSGQLVAHLGNYDPHTKNIVLDKEKTAEFLKNGAQPSERMVGLLKAQGVKLPKWVSPASSKKKAVRNPEKRRSTAPEPKEKPAEEVAKATEPQEQPEAAAEAAEPTEKEHAESPESSEQDKGRESEIQPSATAENEQPAEPESTTDAAENIDQEEKAS